MRVGSLWHLNSAVVYDAKNIPFPNFFYIDFYIISCFMRQKDKKNSANDSSYSTYCIIRYRKLRGLTPPFQFFSFLFDFQCESIVHLSLLSYRMYTCWKKTSLSCWVFNYCNFVNYYYDEVFFLNVRVFISSGIHQCSTSFKKLLKNTLVLFGGLFFLCLFHTFEFKGKKNVQGILLNILQTIKYSFSWALANYIFAWHWLVNEGHFNILNACIQ